jgi:hypothetical protein
MQMSLSDERNLLKLSSPDYPGERAQAPGVAGSDRVAAAQDQAVVRKPNPDFKLQTWFIR